MTDRSTTQQAASDQTRRANEPADGADLPLQPSETGLEAATSTEIETILREIDIRDSHSVLFFGSKAQQQVTRIAEDMLANVRNKDTGPAGQALNEMVATLRGFKIDELDPNRRPGLLSRMLGATKPIARFLQQYESVRRQVDMITDELEQQKTRLLEDIAALDRLYTANLGYLRTLDKYIAAGREALRLFDEQTIPDAEKRAADSDAVLEAQQLRDLRSTRDDLERRIHDLLLTRQVTLQSLPGIRLIQENDKGLVGRISSTIVNTIPLWQQQLATAVTTYRSGEAAASLRSASDLTNELLRANAENLKVASTEARRQIERGVVDIETIRNANTALIETIQESLRITDEGRQRRADAERQLAQCETQLRDALAAAGARREDT
ncbi:MAG: toxic anion resistance protein [Methylotetracoccus sp.]